MKNLTLTVALLIALHASAHAQETTTSKPTDAEKYITWYRDCPVCDAFVSNGDEIRIIRNQGVTIAVAVGDTGKNYAAEIVVLNGSDRRVLVDPEKTLFEIKDGGGKIGRASCRERMEE